MSLEFPGIHKTANLSHHQGFWKLNPQLNYAFKVAVPSFKHEIRLHLHTVKYGTAKKKRPCYLVGNLVATNWPIEKALHAIGYNQIPTK